MAIKISDIVTTIDSGTKLVIKTGNQSSGKVLVSDSDGLVDWVGVKGLVSQDRYIGELYGGGIVVNIWQEGSNENVLIAALQDVSASNVSLSGSFGYVPPFEVQWSTQAGSLKGASSLYDGGFNTSTARSGIATITFQQSSMAINFDGYGSLNGYNDWYLPSLYEMRTIWDSAAVINKVRGEHNFKFGVRDGVSAKYWTSTEVNATQAWMLDLTGIGNFATASKASTARMRPVRLERKTIGNGLVTYFDATNKRSYSDSTLSGRWVDLVNSGLTSSYSFTFASINSTGPTYSSQEGGYLKFNGNSYIDFTSPIGDTNVVTVEMWARLTPGYNNYMLFGWYSYDVRIDGINNLGFNTGQGDTYGINSTQIDNLGLIGNWNHYVFEMRSDVSVSNNKMYINGVLQSMANQTSYTESSTWRNFNGGAGRIGGFRINNSYLAYYDISVFKVYKRSLTQTEITDGFNKYRRKYEIGIPSTHFIDMTTNPGTFSIDQNVKLNIPGKKNQRVLTSTINGTTSWVDKNYLFYRPDNQRFVGEYYGGGIIVSAYNYPTNVFNYTIMSKDDVNQIVTELKYGGSTATRLMVSHDITSWLTVGQITKFLVAGTTKSLAITSITPATDIYTVSSGTLNLTIPDGPNYNTPGTPLVSPALFVDLQFVPTLVEVVVNINHTYIGDLIINLVAPNGNVMNLFNRQNTSNDNLTNTVFSSNLTLPSITTGTAPYTGTFKMNVASGITTGFYVSNVTTLSGLMGGKTINGNWYLVVVDSDVSTIGTLVNWSLKFSGTRTTILLNETLTSTVTYENSKNIVIGATGMSIPWSVKNNLLSTNNFDGSINSNTILAQGYTNSSAALLSDMYNSDGWGDWYLPSSMELVNAFDALASVGYISGTDSVTGDYWTSTNTENYSDSYYTRVSGGSMSSLLGLGSKSLLKKVRAFRKVSILANYKTWNSANPYDEPTGDWYTEAWDEKNWSNYPRVRTSNLIFDFRSDNVFCYSGRLGPYTTTAQSKVGGYTGTLKTGVTWSSDYNAFSFNGTYSTSVLTNSYLVFSNYVSPAPSSNITMEAWVYPTHVSDVGTGKRPILSTNGWENISSAYAGYNISLTSNDDSDMYGLIIEIGNGAGNGYQHRKTYLTGDRVVFRNKWNHIVVIMNGIDILQVYANNVLCTIAPPNVDQTINGTATTVNTTLAGTKMLIGAGFGGVFSIFDGYIGAVRIYNTNLSVTEVKYNFEYDRVRYDV